MGPGLDWNLRGVKGLGHLEIRGWEGLVGKKEWGRTPHPKGGGLGNIFHIFFAGPTFPPKFFWAPFFKLPKG